MSLELRSDWQVHRAQLFVPGTLCWLHRVNLYYNYPERQSQLSDISCRVSAKRGLPGQWCTWSVTQLLDCSLSVVYYHLSSYCSAECLSKIRCLTSQDTQNCIHGLWQAGCKWSVTHPSYNLYVCRFIVYCPKAVEAVWERFLRNVGAPQPFPYKAMLKFLLSPESVNLGTDPV